MKTLFDEVGIEGIVFLSIALIGILILNVDVIYSIVAAFIFSGIVYFLRKRNS